MRLLAVIVGALLVGVLSIVLLDLSEAGNRSSGGGGSKNKNTYDAGKLPKGAQSNLGIYGLVAGICSAIVGLQYLAATLPKTQRLEKLNLQRKVQHIFTGLALTAIFLLLPWKTCVLALGAGTISLGSLQLARFLSDAVNVEFLRFFGSMLKEEERTSRKAPAALHFLIGLFLCLITFPRRLALLCALVATLADPFAAIGGILLGGPRLMPGATLAGSATCWLVATLLALAVILTSGTDAVAVADLAAVALVSGGSAAACEMAGGVLPYLDDNMLTSFGTGLLLLSVDTMLRAGGWHSNALELLLS
ncbi:Uncharacterized protein RP860 [Durusdinium trenchii]|uniref:Uncharacterized protein RP860 n=1 Tax=Durusdinium trenchii TaxID=1381693 RepID=A0ABP0KG75_9DINO